VGRNSLQYSVLFNQLGMRKIIIYSAFLFTAFSCGQSKMETPKNAMEKFVEFKRKEKFIEDNKTYYPGIGNPKLLPTLTEKINEAANDFEIVSKSKNPTDKLYQEKIKIGLERFTDLYLQLDTEDGERICLYFEELMDIVGLESSDGLLTDFMYGFDPNKISKIKNDAPITK
jgi:hypothetical protein